jgi:hypothetical protein
MSNTAKARITTLGKNAYKVGRAVPGVKAIITSKKGEESATIVYKRKADYREDPFGKRA